MNKVDARGEDIKQGRLGLWSSVLWFHAIGRIWPILAIELYESKESLQLMQYSVYKGVKAVSARIVKISKGVVSKVSWAFFNASKTILLNSTSCRCTALAFSTSHPLKSNPYLKKLHPQNKSCSLQPEGELPTLREGWDTPGCTGRSETVYQRAWEIQYLIIFLLFKVSFPQVHYSVEGCVSAAISHRQKRATCRHQAEWETDGQTASETESSGTWSQLCHVPHFQFPFSKRYVILHEEFCKLQPTCHDIQVIPLKTT